MDKNFIVYNNNNTIYMLYGQFLKILLEKQLVGYFCQQGVETETDKFDSNFDEKFEKPEVQNLTPETAVRTPVDRSPPRSRPKQILMVR